jgi:membrane-associated protein
LLDIVGFVPVVLSQLALTLGSLGSLPRFLLVVLRFAGVDLGLVAVATRLFAESLALQFAAGLGPARCHHDEHQEDQGNDDYGDDQSGGHALSVPGWRLVNPSDPGSGGLSMFDWLTQEVSQSPLTYLVVLLAAAIDVLVPLVPSETIAITAGVLAAQGDLLIWVLVPALALGAFLGDNLCYLLGRKIGDPVADRLFDDEKGQARLLWAEEALRRRGAVLIGIGRFLPGGRTVTTFAAGTLEMPYRQFLVADAFAAAIWALYVSMLGYLGGETFEDNLWLPLAGSFACAMAIGFGFEAWRRIQGRRGKDILGDELPDELCEDLPDGATAT